MTDRMESNVPDTAAEAQPQSALQGTEQPARATDWFMRADGPIKPEDVPHDGQHDETVAASARDIADRIARVGQ